MARNSSWTPERRARQVELIKLIKPWEKSTGPRTEAGKAISARNAYKGDAFHEIDALIANSRAAFLDALGRKRFSKGLWKW